MPISDDGTFDVEDMRWITTEEQHRNNTFHGGRIRNTSHSSGMTLQFEFDFDQPSHLEKKKFDTHLWIS